MTEDYVAEELLNRKIKNVKMTNFQNHKYTEYDLTYGSNIITGSSEIGRAHV